MVHLLLAVIYLSFIILGLPDALLGAAWPSMYVQFGVPVSCAGVISMIVAVGTIVSSLQSDRLTRRFGTGGVTAASVAATAAALLGFSLSGSFWALCLWAVPYGLGAGSVDASLNNYVALHYASRHMSWLHCMWGVGAPLSLGQIFRLPGAPEVMTAFFCYCAIEQTIGLWASSYLVLHLGLSSEAAAGFAGLFFLGVTIGRGASGFLTLRLSDTQMVRLGTAILAASLAILLLPLEAGSALAERAALAALLLAGLGCAPVYPCLIHATPAHFGAERSQAVIGVQMASAYVGTCLMPFLFGLIANHISVALFPLYLAALTLVMAVMHRQLIHASRSGAGGD